MGREVSFPALFLYKDAGAFPGEKSLGKQKRTKIKTFVYKHRFLLYNIRSKSFIQAGVKGV